MKNNIIPFPGGKVDPEDNFCGADGFFLGNQPKTRMPHVYELEADALSHINLELKHSDRAGIEYQGLDGQTEEFKKLLLEVLHRRTREHVRKGYILTVSHPLMESHEQIPFLAERSEIPAIVVRKCTLEDMEMMHALRSIFPEVADLRNGLRSDPDRRTARTSLE